MSLPTKALLPHMLEDYRRVYLYMKLRFGQIPIFRRRNNKQRNQRRIIMIFQRGRKSIKMIFKIKRQRMIRDKKLHKRNIMMMNITRREMII